MVEGDLPGKVGIWPEWHRMIAAQIGDGPTHGEAYVASLSDDDVIIASGFDPQSPPPSGWNVGELRADLVSEIDDEGFDPSIIEQRIRNEAGEVIGVESIANPRLRT